MSTREFLDVDPATLHVPGSRRAGADPYKLQRQIAKHGSSIAGMPPIQVSRGTDGELVINDGVTRATRAARYQPGVLVPVEVIDTLPIPGGQFPTIGDLL
jgi:hypothetical protein